MGSFHWEEREMRILPFQGQRAWTGFQDHREEKNTSVSQMWRLKRKPWILSRGSADWSLEAPWLWSQVPTRGSKAESFLAPSSFWWPQDFLACESAALTSASVFTGLPPPVLFLVRTTVHSLRAHPTSKKASPQTPELDYICKDPIHVRPHSPVLGG